MSAGHVTETVGRFTLMINRKSGIACVCGGRHTLQADAATLRRWIRFYKRMALKPKHGQNYSIAVQAHQRALELLEG